MELDFTLVKYSKLCEAIVESRYKPITVEDYLSNGRRSESIILRHDVDRVPERALRMAQIEYEYGIVSTYYFRVIPQVYRPDIIKKIARMGNEIGYHYEVMDKVNGDFGAAIELFEKELDMMREITDIKTVCMHGNPLKPWSNKDLWQHYDYRDYKIIGEPYLSLDYKKVRYFTDTGRRWNNSRYSVKDKTDCSQIALRNTNELIRIIRNEVYPEICILTHPNRWNSSLSQWFGELVFQNIKNIGKMGLNLWYRFRK